MSCLRPARGGRLSTQRQLSVPAVRLAPQPCARDRASCRAGRCGRRRAHPRAPARRAAVGRPVDVRGGGGGMRHGRGAGGRGRCAASLRSLGGARALCLTPHARGGGDAVGCVCVFEEEGWGGTNALIPVIGKLECRTLRERAGGAERKGRGQRAGRDRAEGIPRGAEERERAQRQGQRA